MRKKTYSTIVSASIVAFTLLLTSCPDNTLLPPQGNVQSPGSQFVGAEWAETVQSTSSSSEFNAVDTDQAGNVYAGGNIQGVQEFNFGNGVRILGPYSGFSVALVKYDSQGNAQWVRTAQTNAPSGTVYDSSIRDVFTDSNGNVYVAGSINGKYSYDFGNSVILPADPRAADPQLYEYESAFIAKYDSNGTAQWARRLHHNTAQVYDYNDSRFYSISVSASGNIYVGGRIEGFNTYILGNDAQGNPVQVNGNASDGTNNLILAKYDANGVPVWARSSNSSDHYDGIAIYAIDIDSQENIYVAGRADPGILSLGNGIQMRPNTDSPFVASYDSSGTTRWARSTTGGNTNGYFNGIVADENGSVYAVGRYEITDPFPVDGQNSMIFSTDAQVVRTNRDLSYLSSLIVKFDTQTGYALWAQVPQSSESTHEFYDIDVDSRGDFYVSGSRTINGIGAINFTSMGIGPVSAPSYFLVKYNAQGNLYYATQVSEAGSSNRAYSVSVSPLDESVHIAGRYYAGSTETVVGPGVTLPVFSGSSNWCGFVVAYSSTVGN